MINASLTRRGFYCGYVQILSHMQHLKRSEIDRRLAAGEPSAQVARDYDLNASSLHRHRINCLKLGSSNAIMKDAARGSAAVALLPSKETLSGAYFELRTRPVSIRSWRRPSNKDRSRLPSRGSIRCARPSIAWRDWPDIQPAHRSMSPCKRISMSI